jgi:tetratricopeptide (TPR) repeat protein
MDQEVFPLKAVGDFYNAHFICLKENMFVGEGIGIRGKYDINCFPTFIYLTIVGELAHYNCGSKHPDGLIELGKTALNDSNNMRGLLARFEKGERDTFFLKKLIKSTKTGNQSVCENALSIYWNQIPDTDLFKEDNFKLFKYNEENINSKAFKYIYAHQDEFLTKFMSHEDYRQYGDHARIALEHDSDFLYIKAAEAVKTAGVTNDTILLRRAKEIAFKSKYDDAYYIACIDEIQYFNQTAYWKEFISDVDNYFSKFKVKHFVYDNFAAALTDRTDDKGVLAKALEYNEKCISFGKNYDNVETHAHILFKMGRIDEAIEAVHESIRLATELGEGHKEADELLEQIKTSLAGKN